MKPFIFVEGANTKTFEAFVELEMSDALKHLEKELVKIRTGRAHTSMAEDIKVFSYGTFMPLKELAAISAPEAQLLVIQPWDKTLIPEIEKAIGLSDLGITPINDGTLIRLPMPRMSASRREELVKTVSKRLEECKVSIRNVRKDVHNLIRDTEKGKKVSEDYSKRLQDFLQKITDKCIASSDQLASKKEVEIKSL